jgi:hypothetical protein
MRINFGTSRKPAQQENSKIPNFAYSFQDEVNQAIEDIRDDGTLNRIKYKWIDKEFFNNYFLYNAYLIF